MADINMIKLLKRVGREVRSAYDRLSPDGQVTSDLSVGDNFSDRKKIYFGVSTKFTGSALRLEIFSYSLEEEYVCFLKSFITTEDTKRYILKPSHTVPLAPGQGFPTRCGIVVTTDESTKYIVEVL